MFVHLKDMIHSKIDINSSTGESLYIYLSDHILKFLVTTHLKIVHN